MKRLHMATQKINVSHWGLENTGSYKYLLLVIKFHSLTPMFIRALRVFSNLNDSMINMCHAEGYSTSARLAVAQVEALLDERSEDSAQMHNPYPRT